MNGSSESKDSLKSFTRLCTDNGLLTQPEELENGDLHNGLSDPPTLLRFLAARQFDQESALKQFQEASIFRREKHIVKLYDIVEIADFEQARQFYPHWTGRRDKKGLPICMFDLSRLDKKTLAIWEKSRHAATWSASKSKEDQPPKLDMLQLASVYHDSLTRMVLPLCSMMNDRPDRSTPITSSIYLVDASDLGLKQGWSLRSFAQNISWLLSTCYPETIQRVFVCNAPSYFATIWKYLKSWVDPNTAEKIVVLSSTETLPVLEEHIDNVNIPTAFGGGFTFRHGMLPDLDENIWRRFSWRLPSRSLPPGPIKWTKDLSGGKVALADKKKSYALVLSKVGSAIGGSPVSFGDGYGAAIWAIDFHLASMTRGVKRMCNTMGPDSTHSF
ncbi:hypothetical protein N7523_011000 [Penicillium sp. IBT 18751x]|nr:hypothetical protein N7523_011000 [Penicillium sp. IBT 18751x]